MNKFENQNYLSLTMVTIKLNVSDKILDKVLRLLGQFKSEDLQIIESSSEFESNKSYLDKELSRLHSGEAKTFSIDETDDFLEKTIQQYEG